MSLENCGVIIIFSIVLIGCAYWQGKYARLYETLHKIIGNNFTSKTKFGYTIKDKTIILSPNLERGYDLKITDFNRVKL